MARPTLDEIFSEPDAFGLLDVGPNRAVRSGGEDRAIAALEEVSVFFERSGRVPDPDAPEHDEMRLGAILTGLRKAPTSELLAADRLGLLACLPPASGPGGGADWRDDPADDEIPRTLDEIFADDGMEVDERTYDLKFSRPFAERERPGHRADFVPCRDFDLFRERIEQMQAALISGDRSAVAVRKRAVIEPVEGDFFIRNGLLALIAEKSEMSARGGDRDHRLRVIFSNGTESDPLMSSFRKSLSEDRTARMVEHVGFGPLDPDWEADRLETSGTIYVARSLSDDPAIAPLRAILHKIGVTGQDVRRRVADARNDPTFLLAPVDVVATYALTNLPRRKVEDLLHRFFEAARPGQLFVTDRFGKKVYPREWFYILPEHVGTAARLIQDKILHRYRYDPERQAIVER